MNKPTDRILFSQLRAIAELWESIQNTVQPADRYLANYFHQNRKIFGSRDRRFLSETVYALFRHKTLLQIWADKTYQTGSQRLALMAMAAEDILEEKTLEPLLEKEIIQALQERRLPYDISKLPINQVLSQRYSMPLWLVDKWVQFFGSEETEKLVIASNQRPPFTIRVNTLKTSRENLLEKFRDQEFKISKTPGAPNGIIFRERVSLLESEEFREGLFEIQDEGSQRVCEKIDAKPGEVIWDVCAGGGGKTLAMAAKMENKGRVVATDKRSFKLDELRKRAKRAGAMNIFPAELERIGESSIAKKGFDKIVVDAPCSGSGTLRRNADAKWKLNADVLQRNHQDQVMIIENALPYLKPGGKLCYITCSLEPEENEKVMEEIFSKHPELKLVSLDGSKDGFYKLYPHTDQTDGFFLAIAEKTSKMSQEITP